MRRKITLALLFVALVASMLPEGLSAQAFRRPYGRRVHPAKTAAPAPDTVKKPTAYEKFLKKSGLKKETGYLKLYTDGTDVWEYAASKSVTLADGKYYQVKVEMSKAGSSYTVGHFLNKDGSITPKKFTSGTNESVAVIAHAGAVKGYCSEFIAIALEDVSTEMSYWADAMTALDTWAAAHPVTIGGNTYNKNSSGTFYYDKVTPGSDKPSASNTYPAEKGWRMPSVTDWRYIFQSLCGGPSATNPVGVEQNGVYGDKDALRAAINNACGNTNLVDRWYWTSSLLYDEYIEDYAWHYNFWDDGDFSWATKQNMFRTRAVFAY